jgi:hypothetical protein
MTLVRKSKGRFERSGFILPHFRYWFCIAQLGVQRWKSKEAKKQSLMLILKCLATKASKDKPACAPQWQ